MLVKARSVAGFLTADLEVKQQPPPPPPRPAVSKAGGGRKGGQDRTGQAGQRTLSTGASAIGQTEDGRGRGRGRGRDRHATGKALLLLLLLLLLRFLRSPRASHGGKTGSSASPVTNCRATRGPDVGCAVEKQRKETRDSRRAGSHLRTASKLLGAGLQARNSQRGEIQAEIQAERR